MAIEPQGLPVSRRRFVQGAGVAGLGLLTGCGRLPFAGVPPAPPLASRPARLGFLTSFAPSFQASPNAEALRDGLRQLGWVESQNLTIDWRFAAGDLARLPALAAELLELPVDLVVTSTGVEARAAMTLTSTVPIVFASAGDVIATGTVPSLAHPGGNATGLTNIAPELSGKRLEFLKDALPHAARVGAIWNGTDQSMALEYGESSLAADTLGVELQSFSVRDEDEIVAALETAATARLDGLVVISDIFISRYRGRIVQLAAAGALPTISGDPDYAVAGGLMSYGPNRADMYRRAATFVDKILRGTRPADLPVERPMRFDLVINLQTARALGVTIPDRVLGQATELVQ